MYKQTLVGAKLLEFVLGDFITCLNKSIVYKYE